MGVSKSNLFNQEQNDIASLAKVLCHPARIAILQHLMQSETCINSNLTEILGLAQPTVSQHLKELKSAGLIQGTIMGNSMNYCISQEGWTRLQMLLGNFIMEKRSQEVNCCN